MEKRNVPEARVNAEFILAEVLKAGRNEALLRCGEPLAARRLGLFWRYLKKRGRRIPLAYVLGYQNFMGLDMSVSPHVLIPRPETEELVVEARKRLRSLHRSRPHVLEIGTGTGCIAIALAKSFPEATLRATDIQAKVLKLAAKNALRHGVGRRLRFLRENLFRPSPRRARWADMVVSNPPYIPTAEIRRLEPEVRHEPRLALDGGKDGLAFLRAIAALAARLLKPGGFLALEIGDRQGPAVREILAGAIFQDIEILRDAQGLDRMAFGTWS